LEQFYNRSDAKDRKQSWCKACDKIRTDLYLQSNKELVAEKKKLIAVKNRQKLLEYGASWRRKNSSKMAAYASNRRVIKLQATPKWSDAKKIQEIYDFAAFMKWITCGIEYHVDHIIPLKGKVVCGLHVENNLQVLRVDHNLAKYNKFLEA
jgi:hypothetical protein